VKGAFTGAVRTRKGLVEEAHQGTLFLDEIGELSVSLQAKLLRVLENEEVRPIGDTRITSVDVRLLCATSRDLAQAVRQGAFREDLLYRINVLTLHLPPLRERPEDIPPLLERFIESSRQRIHAGIKGIVPSAMKVLLEHSWPGNVRELEHAIERAAILTSDGWISIEHLPPELFRARERDDDGAGLSIKRGTRALEQRLIRRALKQTGGNRTHAAVLLEISHRALLYKIKEYGIHDAEVG
jgi:two-component system response regulator AtoC